MARFKRHEIPESGSINMTPMMDVIFQLLIFFVLTSSITKPTQIELSLPESTSGVKAKSEDVITVTYRLESARPEITFNATQVASLGQLGEIMRQHKGSGSKTPVDIRIERTVPYQDVISLMDTVRDAGFPKFSLLTIAKSTTPSR